MTFAAHCDPAAGLALALAGLLLGSRHQSRPFRFLDGAESLAPELRSAVSSVRRARLSSAHLASVAASSPNTSCSSSRIDLKGQSAGAAHASALTLDRLARIVLSSSSFCRTLLCSSLI